ncbi:tryptophan-rich sensory protein [Mycolicibacterium sp.]|jgi:cell division protein FtsW (lipid II flippase)|uniref:tryptophan-rich sensory protein n=1 Tax=Mycolicibacterium sp. TaxID=2320850 RepID=UPI001A19B8D1|nr:tryptophan-rich sensory protein [Mycolicibacterium sp.]MBJ7400098.1 tryptophan-rich sensory protein [Mycolicibacterium sp.]
MSTSSNRGPVKALVALTYLAMVTMNILANTLPLNGRRTGEVSDSYPSLFTPAGLTFSVWGLIYLLLGAHVLYQLGLFRDCPDTAEQSALLNRVGVLFAVSSLANTAWVFAWHYDHIPLSVVLIVVILVCLALIATALQRVNLTGRRRWFIGVPFSVYFGWTTVAVVANITVLMVSLKWDGFGLSDATWAVIIVLVAMAIGTATMVRNRDVAYGLVLIWAFVGILIQQMSADGFAGRYPAIIGAVIASLVIYVVVEIMILRDRSIQPTVPA